MCCAVCAACVLCVRVCMCCVCACVCVSVSVPALCVCVSALSISLCAPCCLCVVRAHLCPSVRVCVCAHAQAEADLKADRAAKRVAAQRQRLQKEQKAVSACFSSHLITSPLAPLAALVITVSECYTNHLPPLSASASFSSSSTSPPAFSSSRIPSLPRSSRPPARSLAGRGGGGGARCEGGGEGARDSASPPCSHCLHRLQDSAFPCGPPFKLSETAPFIAVCLLAVGETVILLHPLYLQ